MTILIQCDVCADISDLTADVLKRWEISDADDKYRHICPSCRKTIAWLERGDDNETYGEAQSRPLPPATDEEKARAILSKEFGDALDNLIAGYRKVHAEDKEGDQ